MQLATAGVAHLGGSNFHAIKSIEFNRYNILTSSSFAPPPRKSFLQRLVEFLNRSIQP